MNRECCWGLKCQLEWDAAQLDLSALSCRKEGHPQAQARKKEGKGRRKSQNIFLRKGYIWYSDFVPISPNTYTRSVQHQLQYIFPAAGLNARIGCPRNRVKQHSREGWFYKKYMGAVVGNSFRLRCDSKEKLRKAPIWFVLIWNMHKSELAWDERTLALRHPRETGHAR